ncbi:hypothetical protein AB8O55_29650 [Saccharopolyspora cebuensis]|uniref:Uncharacterized protein n=1 Tax=Saccharopolyspora cebuensis TaxID=418759 RepID=A0ABV4CR72_9PSEU
MNEHTWRQSGLDARSHAFASEGGFLWTRSADLVSLPEPATYHVTSCGQSVPVAYVMTRNGGAPCGVCARGTAVVELRNSHAEQLAALDAPPLL